MIWLAIITLLQIVLISYTLILVKNLKEEFSLEPPRRLSSVESPMTNKKSTEARNCTNATESSYKSTKTTEETEEPLKKEKKRG